MMTIVTNQADGYRSKYRRSSVSTSESVGQSQAGAYILPFKHFDAQLDNQCMLCHPPSICHTTCWLNIRPPPFSLSLSLSHTHTHTHVSTSCPSIPPPSHPVIRVRVPGKEECSNSFFHACMTWLTISNRDRRPDQDQACRAFVVNFPDTRNIA